MDQSYADNLFGMINWCSNPVDSAEDIGASGALTPPTSSALSYSVRTQIYILSMLSNKHIAKFFLDEVVSRILDNLHNLAEGFSGNMLDADNLKQWIIELILNLQVFHNNRDVFNRDDRKLVQEFREQFILFAKYVIELYEFNLIVDRFLLQRKCEKCQKLMHMIIGNRLDREKHQRIDFIFNFISNKKFVKYVFDSKSGLNAAILKEIIKDLGVLATEGLI